MSRTLSWQLAGADVVLHAECALYYPAESALLVADTCFGKAALTRRQVLAVPGDQSRDELQRLSTLLQEFSPQRLIVLGDFFDHLPRPGEPFLDLFPEWLAQHQRVSVEAVVGNQHRHVAGVDLGLQWHDELDLGPFRLRHEPEPVPGRHVLAGHLHPMLTLQVAAQRLRAPVFWLREQISVLPSFGALTGGWDLPRKPEGHTVMVIDGALFQGPD